MDSQDTLHDPGPAYDRRRGGPVPGDAKDAGLGKESAPRRFLRYLDFPQLNVLISSLPRGIRENRV